MYCEKERVESAARRPERAGQIEMITYPVGDGSGLRGKHSGLSSAETPEAVGRKNIGAYVVTETVKTAGSKRVRRNGR